MKKPQTNLWLYYYGNKEAYYHRVNQEVEV